MELKWLEDFVAIVHTRNFSRAAEIRHITQPGLSRRLKSLEMWFGAPLIDRSTYPVTLTPAGEMFYELANRTVTDLYHAKRQAKSAEGGHDQTIQFAMPHSLAMCFFPTWWQHHPARHPKLTTKVVADNFNACVEMLANRSCHFLVCYLHPSSQGALEDAVFSGLKIGQDTLIPVSVPNASGKPRFALPKEVDSPKTFELVSPPTPLLAFAPDSFLGKVATSILRSQSHLAFQTTLVYESALAESIKVQALMGEGLAWLPRKMVDRELSGGDLVLAGSSAWQASLDIWLYCHVRETQPVVKSVWSSIHTE